jgi:hypothetical protein
MKTKLLFIVLFTSHLSFSQDITSDLEASFLFNDGTAAVSSGTVTQAGVINGATLIDDRFGNSNSAMSFDGVNDYIDFGNLSNYQFGSDSFTIALWMYGALDQSGQGIPIGKRGFNGGQDYAYMFGWRSNGELLLYYRDDSGSAETWPTTTVDADSWSHIAMVFDRSTSEVMLYKNASLISAVDISTLTTFNASGTTDGQLMIGRSSNGGQYFSGYIDDVYVFRRALNNTDITALYEAEDPTLSVKEFEKGPLSVYPNPTNNVLKINSNKVLGAIITNAQGAFIRSIEIKEETTIDVSNYAQGVYFIRTEEGQTVKFVKQ